jgi:hypothetical protein
MEQPTVWSILGMVSSLVKDIASIIALVSSGLIFILTLISGFTKKRLKRMGGLWESAILGLLFGIVGFTAKLFDITMPNGFVFQFSQPIIGIMLFISLLMLVSSAVLSRMSHKG